ncbi:MAG: radical SAM protein, partial [Paraburkholderia tropica]
MNASVNLPETTRPESILPESKLQLLTELQSSGLRLAAPDAAGLSRRGGAGPSDHKAVVIDGV